MSICLRHLPFKLTPIKVMVRHNSSPILWHSSATFAPQTKPDYYGHNLRYSISFDANEDSDLKNAQFDSSSSSFNKLSLHSIASSHIPCGVSSDQTMTSSVCSLHENKLIVRRSVPVTVLKGYLDSTPISVYCFNINQNDNDNAIINGQLLSEREKRSINWINDNKDMSETMNKSTQKNDRNTGKPDPQQLNYIFHKLSEIIPKFFTLPHDYQIYSQHIEFYDNIRGVKTHGITSYVQQIAMIRVLSHFKYSHIKMNVLKITQHPEDGTVRVRWRAVGVPGLRRIFMFWKFRLWEWGKIMSKEESDWIDGFSVFSVGSDGLIYKHVCDKIMPDEERNQLKTSNNVAVKLALLLGLTARPSNGIFDDLSELIP